jgi:hypothetical protein
MCAVVVLTKSCAGGGSGGVDPHGATIIRPNSCGLAVVLMDARDDTGTVLAAQLAVLLLRWVSVSRV